MATNELQAKITADISGLESGLKKAEKLQSDYGKSIQRTQKEIAQNIQISKGYENAIEQLNKEFKSGAIGQKEYQKQLQRLQRDEKETAIDTANLRKELAKLKRDQKDLAGATGTTAKSISGVGKSSANATPTLIEFSRVIQDAPYGIQGVANNIQQLTTNFGYLKKSAGGTVPALKALAASFAGPAGIVFAVSTITSLLVTYGDELFKSANKTEDLEKKVDSLTDAFDSELRISEAIEESLTLQGKSTTDILNQRKELIRTQIQGLSNLLEEQKQLLDIKKLENERVDNLEILQQSFQKIFTVGVALAKLTFNFVSDQAIDNAKELFNIEIDRSKFQSASAKDKEEEVALQTQYNNLVAQQMELENDILEINKKQIETAKEASRPKNLQKASQLTPSSELSPLPGGDISGSTDTLLEDRSQQINEYIATLQKGQEATKLFTDASSAAFGAFAQSLSQSFQTGNAVLDAFLSSVVTGLSKMLSQMVATQAQEKLLATQSIATDQAKATSSAIVAGSQTAAASGPAAAFLLPALIAGAVALIAGAFGGLKFAGGGIVPGGSFNGDKVPAMLNSGEMILNSGQQANLFKALNGSLSSLQGRSNSTEIVGEVILRGQNQLVQLTRAEKKHKRYYNS